MTIDTDDVTTGVKSIKLFEYAGSGSNRLWEQPWGPRPDCTLDQCAQHKYTVSYTLDPISRGWQNGRHDLDVEAKDAAENASPPQPWQVSFWKTSWQPGGSDHRINTTGEINDVRAALAPIGGVYDPTNPVWPGWSPSPAPGTAPASSQARPEIGPSSTRSHGQSDHTRPTTTTSTAQVRSTRPAMHSGTRDTPMAPCSVELARTIDQGSSRRRGPTVARPTAR